MYRTAPLMKLLAATAAASSLTFVMTGPAEAVGCQGLSAPWCNEPTAPVFPPRELPTLDPLPDLTPPPTPPSVDSSPDSGLSCSDCIIEVEFLRRSADVEKARVAIPVEFLEVAEAIWLRSEDGDSQRLWPLDYNRGDVSFEQQFVPDLPGESAIEGGPLGFMITEDAMRFAKNAEVYLAVRLHDDPEVSRLFDAQLLRGPANMGGSPASGGCSACNLQIDPGNTMTLRIPYQLLWSQLTLAAGSKQVQAWPPTTDVALQSVRAGANGTMLLKLPSAGASSYSLSSRGAGGQVFYTNYNGQGGALIEY